MRCVFVGTPGFLGRIDSETRCAFWAEESVDHGFDPTRLIDVDFARTPSAAAAREIAWDAVQVDDCFAGPNGVLSGTTLSRSCGSRVRSTWSVVSWRRFRPGFARRARRWG